MVRYLKTPEAKDKFIAMGSETVGDAPEEFAAFIRSDVERLGKLARDLGIAAR